MAKLKVRDLVRELEPMEWVDGTDQPVRAITYPVQEILDDVGDGTLAIRQALPDIMPQILPGKTWDEIKSALDAEAMLAVLHYAGGKTELVRQYIAELQGNAVAGTMDPASSPPTPAVTSSPASPAPTGAPCGTS
jgi:hypothetical protein